MSEAAVEQGPCRTLFQPLKIGSTEMRTRVMMPPHASAIGNIYGSRQDAERNIAYFERRAKAGVAWTSALSTLVANHLIPGFDPTGVGATVGGYFRLPQFVENVQQFTDALHRLDTKVSVHIPHQAGMPHAPSNTLGSMIVNAMPHVMDDDDIVAFIKEYAYSAKLAMQARADGIELHFNHDDIFEQFMSPLTNKRDDRYGGSLENRCRFGTEVLTAIREQIGDSKLLGFRINLYENLPGGYTIDDCIEICQYFESTGLIDYLHGVIGTPWGNPSYIQPSYYKPGLGRELAGQLKAAVSLPVIYTGRVHRPEIAEQILAAGQADMIGIARAHIADGQLLLKAREGRLDEIRPCLGCNECISRRYTEGLAFSCAVNPAAQHELEGPLVQRGEHKQILVVGGGPAGMEFAALAAEAGNTVTLWEAADRLGGQFRYTTLVPGQPEYGRYLRWQQRRLDRVGVNVMLGKRARAEDVIAAGAQIVVVATGATPRRLTIPGGAQDNVFEIREVIAAKVKPGKRVFVICQDDHLPPLSLADYLATAGHQVTLSYGTHGPAVAVGRYHIGGILGRLSEQGVAMRFMERPVAIDGHRIEVADIYSDRRQTVGEFDSFIFACGSESDAELYRQVKNQVPSAHLLGDAYAPRRMGFATKQAYALAAVVTGRVASANA